MGLAWNCLLFVRVYFLRILIVQAPIFYCPHFGSQGQFKRESSTYRHAIPMQDTDAIHAPTSMKSQTTMGCTIANDQRLCYKSFSLQFSHLLFMWLLPILSSLCLSCWVNDICFTALPLMKFPLIFRIRVLSDLFVLLIWVESKRPFKAEIADS